ncbi:MAG: glycine cleavage system aminomethyltransferase GcvT [Bacteroidota bacterium]
MKKTKFYNVHKKLGAKLIEFAGYLMPVQYSSIINEHKVVRNSVGVFDVSHMGEVIIKGERALDFVQYITINDASKLSDGRVQYSAMCYEDGGIVDDLLIYRMNKDEYFLVINASNIEKDIEWMNRNNSFGVEIINESDEYSLLAVQGPNSKKVLQEICNADLDLEYYNYISATCVGIDMIISRTGYTGELGYEIYFKADEKDAINFWELLFDKGKKYQIEPVGLGARDSLRLEMGFCLYGNDIDETTNPIEAGLGWITRLSKDNFIGKDAIAKIKADGLKRKLVAMVSDEKVLPRHGYQIAMNGEIVGNITSGTLSPILGYPIALGYVDKEYSDIDTQVNVKVRSKDVSATIVKLPFIKK